MTTYAGDAAPLDGALLPEGPTVRLGGCRADLRNRDQAISTIISRSRRGTRPGLGVVSVNLDHVNHFGPASRWHRVFEAAEASCDLDWLHLLDGAPLVQQAQRLTGASWPRLAGSDLIDPLLRAAQAQGCSVGFLGGAQPTQLLLGERLPAMYPTLDVRGMWSPERTVLSDPAASRSLAEEVREAGVDMLVVGLGKPRQELWIAEYGALTGAGSLLAFGAVVDFLAGEARRAPAWCSDHGLEWAWRLSCEPRRLARRYLVQGPPAYLRLRRDSGTAPPALPAPTRVPVQRRPPPTERPDGFVGPGRHADVAVLVVTYRNAEHVDPLLNSLRAEARTQRIRVVVADNGSGDGTLDRVRRHADVVSLSTGGNLGYAAGINAAARHAGDADALLVLNPDVVLRPGAVAAMRARLTQPGVGAVVPRLEEPDGSTYPSLRREPTVLRSLGEALLGDHLPERPHWMSEMDRDPDSYRHPHEVDWATGAAVMVDRSVADAVGEWDEGFFLYSEETDYCRRLRESGHQIWFEPGAAVRHDRGGSGASPDLTALMSVNRIRYAEKYGSRAEVGLVRTATALGSALRLRRPEHRTALAFVTNRESWKDLPRATSTPGPADLASFPTGSVVIPAHDEAAVIGRTLAVLAPLAAARRVEVVVACNGCSDDTATIARSHPGVVVLEMPQASKTAALNAADAVARWWPRLYLDADIDLPVEALRDLFDHLHRGEVLAARPPFEYDLSGSGALVRCYYRARRRLPGTAASLWGAGAYAMTREGRGRFGPFPDVTADDLFVDRCFAPHEKAVVGNAPVSVHAPRNLEGLMAVLRRTYRGNRQLGEAPQGGASTTAANLGSLVRSARGPLSAVDAVTYASLALVARLWVRRVDDVRWERDETSRA